MLQAAVLFVGVFGVFAIGIVFFVQYTATGQNPAVPLSLVTSDEERQLWLVFKGLDS